MLIFQRLLPYIVISVFLIGLNFLVYQYLISNQNNQNLALLQGYQNSVKTLLLRDLEFDMSGSNKGKKFLLFKNTKFQKKSEGLITNSDSPVHVNNYAIIVQNLFNEWTFDLQEFREFLDKTLPSYIGYKVEVNKNNIASSTNYEQLLKFKETHDLKKESNILIELGIDTRSEYHINNMFKIHYQLILSLCFSFLTSFIVIFFYQKQKLKEELKITALESALSKEYMLTLALLENKKMSQKLKLLFIKKATELVVLQKSDKSQKLELKPIRPEEYLFPLVLTDHRSSAILTKELIDSLNSYFGYHFNIIIKIESDLEKIKVDCAKEVFFQIVFSLIYNIIMFMENQSNKQKEIIIHITKNKLIVTYESFFMDKKQMINISNLMLKENIDTFLLSCERLFKSLNTHDLNYELYYSLDGKNIVEIAFTKTINIIKKSAKIFDFTQYSKNKKQ